MNYLFFDTETTGKALFKESLSHKDQPHLAQIALIHCDKDLNPITQVKEYVKLPEGVSMPDEASKVHGITDEILKEKGICYIDIFEMFYKYLSNSSVVVCHNIDFDMFIMRVLATRHKNFIKKCEPVKYQKICTMKSSTNVCKIPGPYGFKWPKLEEAYKILVNPDGFDGAHDALVDVLACKSVFIELKNRNIPLIH